MDKMIDIDIQSKSEELLQKVFTEKIFLLTHIILQ